jgi:hypothetical protein
VGAADLVGCGCDHRRGGDHRGLLCLPVPARGGVRALGALSRIAAAVATLLVAAAVIYGQEYGLDPDNGSLSGLAIIYTPMYAVLLALLVFGADRATAWLFRRGNKSV